MKSTTASRTKSDKSLFNPLTSAARTHPLEEEQQSRHNSAVPQSRASPMMREHTTESLELEEQPTVGKKKQFLHPFIR